MIKLTKILMLAAFAAVVLPIYAMAVDGDAIKAEHRQAVEAYLAVMDAGVVLTGTVTRNDSQGVFKAYHFNDAWLVRQEFGPIVWLGYTGPEGSWSGSNYNLPFQVEPQDSPANAVMELLTGGSYLDDPYWEYFNFVSEDAGGYNFTFTPPDLPAVDAVLYSDPEEPDYLQVMSLSLHLAPHDDNCVLYRTFYYYDTDDQGRLITTRETGRELDPNGETSNFTEYIIDSVEWPEEQPAEMTFDFDRTPFSQSAAGLSEPVTITTKTDDGYFMVPITFAGSEETFWFILDTGASSSLFSPAAAEAAGLEPVITLPTYGHSSSAQFTLGMCTTAALGEACAANAPLDGFIATRVPEENDLLGVFESYGVAGLLGISPLHQYVTTFDHLNGKIILTPPQLFEAGQIEGPDTYVMEVDAEDLAYIPARINDVLDGEVVIDTGLAVPQELALLRETMEYHDVEMQTLSESNSTVVGGVMAFEYVRIPSFELLTSFQPEDHGPLRMSGAVASLSEDDHGSHSARDLLGFVGMTMFLDVRVTIDLFNQKLYYEVPSQMIRADEDLSALVSEIEAEFGKPGPDDAEAGAAEDEADAAGDDEPAAEENTEDEAETPEAPDTSEPGEIN
ncbi:retropepsin-like domain-containing protein [bacterium]|nr:retropepsin-like domain-containing protein [bacterium]